MMITIVKGGAKDEHKRVNSGLGTQWTRAAQVLNQHLIITSSPPHHHPCHCFHIFFFFMVIPYIHITTTIDIVPIIIGIIDILIVKSSSFWSSLLWVKPSECFRKDMKGLLKRRQGLLKTSPTFSIKNQHHDYDLNCFLQCQDH